jgi:hypothetical protein
LLKAIIVASALLALSTSANATCGFDRDGSSLCPGTSARERGSSRNYSDAAVVGGRPAGCPHRYCGCEVSLKVFGRIIPELNLALNWKLKFPRTAAAAGMVAARSGHVFYILGVNSDSSVLAYDPNSGGGKTRIHTVGLRGYTVVDPNGNRLALN